MNVSPQLAALTTHDIRFMRTELVMLIEAVEAKEEALYRERAWHSRSDVPGLDTINASDAGKRAVTAIEADIVRAEEMLSRLRMSLSEEDAQADARRRLCR